MIDSYGWSEALQNDFQPYAEQGLVPARVIVQHRGGYRLVTPFGELAGGMTGKLRSEAVAGGYPVAGDWVAVEARPEEGSATIHAVLPRTTTFIRRAAGPGGGAQVVAANVDVAFLAASLNADLSLRRLERYLATALESGSKPVIVLTKSDAADDLPARIAEVEAIAAGAPVHAVSALTGEGLDQLLPYLAKGTTSAVMGSSGVGKSTLINALAGKEIMDTGGIREDDDRGRHTTTHRELVLLPNGALVLDTPGMRELGLWNTEAGVATAFDDVEALALNCRFSDCRHGNEPGCAINAAMASGDLDPNRWAAYQKLQRELTFVVRKDDPRLRAETRKVWIQRQKDFRARKRMRDDE